MDAEFLMKAVGFILLIIGQVVLVSRMVSRHGFKIETLEKKVEEQGRKVDDQSKKLEKKFDKLTHDLFPGGKPVFIYKDDCKGCHKEICDVINKGMSELKEEFKKTDGTRASAHANLHRKIDDLQTEVIMLKARDAK